MRFSKAFFALASVAQLAFSAVASPLTARGGLAVVNDSLLKREPVLDIRGKGHGHGNACDKGTLLNLGLDLDLDLLSAILADLDLCVELSLGGKKGALLDILLDLSLVVDLGGKLHLGGGDIGDHCGCDPHHPPTNPGPKNDCLHKVVVKLDAVLKEIGNLGKGSNLDLKKLNKAVDALASQLLECLGLEGLDPTVKALLDGLVGLVGNLTKTLDNLLGGLTGCGCSGDKGLLDAVANLLHGKKGGLLGIGLLGLRADDQSEIYDGAKTIVGSATQLVTASKELQKGCGCSSSDPVGKLIAEILALIAKIKVDLKLALTLLDIGKCKSLLDVVLELIVKLNLLCKTKGVLDVTVKLVVNVLLPLCLSIKVSLELIIKLLGTCGCGKDSSLLKLILKLFVGLNL